MSRTVLYKFNKKKEMEEIKEYHNSNRGASLLWGYFGKKYFGDDFSMWNDDDAEKLWKLVEDPNVKWFEKVLLASTFDHCMIKRKNIYLFIIACKQYIDEYSNNKFGAGHWEEYPNDLLKALEDKHLKAICWNQTTVCCQVWDIHTKPTFKDRLKYLFHGDMDELEDLRSQKMKYTKSDIKKIGAYHLFEQFPNLIP